MEASGVQIIAGCSVFIIFLTAFVVILRKDMKKIKEAEEKVYREDKEK